MKKTLGETIGELRLEIQTLENVIATQRAEIAKLTEAEVRAKSTAADERKTILSLRADIELLQLALDNLPNVPARKPEGANSWEPEMPVLVRFCVYLASQGNRT